MKYRNIYIGEVIRQKCKERNISVSQFAKAMNCSRTGVYNIFHAKSIDTDKLIQISNVLDYGFLEEYIRKDFPAINTQILLNVELKNGIIHIKQLKDDTPTV